MKSERRLISTRRTVSAARREAYEAAWSRVHFEATRQGSHAWRFASAARGDLFLEFLEFAADSDPRREPQLADALARIEAEFTGEGEEWVELRGS